MSIFSKNIAIIHPDIASYSNESVNRNVAKPNNIRKIIIERQYSLFYIDRWYRGSQMNEQTVVKRKKVDIWDKR